MKDVMIDFETLGNTPMSVVIQIGACEFDRDTGEIGEKLLLNVNPQSELAWGFEVTGSTIFWWMEQGDEARKSVTKKGIKSKDAFSQLNDFLKGKVVWSHATFDVPILTQHLSKLMMYPKFSFRDARDLRTLQDLYGKNHWDVEKREGTYHNALDDCIYQSKWASKMLKELKEKNDRA